MPFKIIALYCFFDEPLKALNHKDDPQATLTTAEIMTVAAEFFTGNQQAALEFLVSHRYIVGLANTRCDIKPFSKSRFNRRLHALPETLWQSALYALAQRHQQANPDGLCIVDTFPVPASVNVFPCAATFA